MWGMKQQFMKIIVCIILVNSHPLIAGPGDQYNCSLDIQRLVELVRESDYKTYSKWVLRGAKNGITEYIQTSSEPLAISLGLSRFNDSIVFEVEEKLARYLDMTSILAYEADKQLTHRKLLPPLFWNTTKGSPTENITTLAAQRAIKVMDLIYKKAKQKNDKGPLFVFHFDDFDGLRVLDSQIKAITADIKNAKRFNKLQYTEDELAELQKLAHHPLRYTESVYNESCTEHELRLLLRNPNYLKQTLFYLKGKVMTYEEVAKLLGNTELFPALQANYKPNELLRNQQTIIKDKPPASPHPDQD